MKRSFSIIVIFVALALLGITLISQLPVKLMPSKSLPSLYVNFSMPNTSARVVESEVTGKLESMLSRIQGVKDINSSSYDGGGNINISLDKHANIQHVRFEAATIVRQAWPQLPNGVSYPRVSTAQTSFLSGAPVLTYTINSTNATSTIKTFAEETISPQVSHIAGVSKVQLNGALPLEWHLTYNNDLLKAYGLTPSMLSSAIAEQCSSQFLGTAVTDSGEWLSVRSEMSGNDVDADNFDFSKIIIYTPTDSIMLHLDQLVSIQHIEARPTNYSRINGLNAVYYDIFVEQSANQIEVASQVKNLIASIHLPEGYSMSLTYDATETISTELNNIYYRTTLTLIILLIFVALVTHNLRYMMVVMISLFLSLAASFIIYFLADVEIQLYSLAGITISFNLVIDNIIVICDHYLRCRNLRTFTAMLAATLTTIGALSVVFFLDDGMRLNLQDFVVVVIVNLAVSLVTALFLVPALINQIGITKIESRPSRRRLKFTARFNKFYSSFIRFTLRKRRWLIAILVLAFGLPTFLLPEQIEGNDTYNKTLGSKTYNEKIRPWVDGILGGTLRLFVQDVFEGSYFNDTNTDPTLNISATLPNGATLEQMNELIKRMEAFLATFSEVKRFRTDVSSARRANIAVSFTKKAVKQGFPYQLKSQVVSKALTLGGGSWSVYGLEDQGFNNNIVNIAGSYRVKLTGYNYDELEELTEQFRQVLLSHRRIKDVTVNSEFSWYKDDYSEFYLEIDRDALARRNLSVAELYTAMNPVFSHNAYCGTTPDGKEQIYIGSLQSETYDVWTLMNSMFTINNKAFKLSDFATLTSVESPHAVAKENQQYRMCLQYEYIGSPIQAKNVLERDMQQFRKSMPLGYAIESPEPDYGWGSATSKNVWLLLLVIVIVFFITSILFNSLTQPFVIILTIPVSFIGVFLAFYLSGMNFDQGGAASFVLLSGLTVNAAIYLMNEYNKRGKNNIHAYIRAFNVKIIPILLTVLSTILGFIPFMVGTDGRQGFWFPLALGSIGGLIMSLFALIVFLPSIALPRTLGKKQQRNAK